MPAVDLIPGDHLRGAHHVGAGLRVGPRRRVQSVADRHRHQLVVRRVVADDIDAVAVAVVGAQNRRILVRPPAELLRLLRSCPAAELVQLVTAPTATFPFDAFDQRRVAPEPVVPDERRSLVDDLVRIEP